MNFKFIHNDQAIGTVSREKLLEITSLQVRIEEDQKPFTYTLDVRP